PTCSPARWPPCWRSPPERPRPAALDARTLFCRSALVAELLTALDPSPDLLEGRRRGEPDAVPADDEPHAVRRGAGVGGEQGVRDVPRERRRLRLRGRRVHEAALGGLGGL